MREDESLRLLSEAGRQALADVYDATLACVRCGLCLTSCPTYVLTLHEAEGPRGRIAMIRGLAEGRLPLTDDLIRHQTSCLVCDACSAVCPAGVRMDPLQAALRAAVEPAVRRSPGERLLRRLALGRVLADMRLLRLAVRLLRLYQRSGLHRAARRLGLLRVARLVHADALLPPLPARPLVPRGEVYPAIVAPPESQPASVSLFAGCVMSTVFADIDRATIRVLQRAGCEVEDPVGQGCCGALHAHAGEVARARDLARRNITAFERGTGGPIVVNSAGCGAMLKDYAHLLRDDPDWAARAADFSARVQDVTEFLAALPAPDPQPLPPNPRVVTYQDACHLAHAQGITRPPRALLGRTPGVKLVEMADGGLCCGSAGIYNLTQPETARQLRERKLDHALATGADVIVTANPGCLLHLRAGLAERGSAVQVKHIVELLDEAGTASLPGPPAKTGP
ncbi:MAG TPA: heterodisulfide reductase-related iron-sulfur binding cluster, partial [Dehalococcoidia bacterium]|nr:heterodisulfide reductase-related iron-sulfur binding cluster [Dehalococcoidia bacterium]